MVVIEASCKRELRAPHPTGSAVSDPTGSAVRCRTLMPSNVEEYKPDLELLERLSLVQDYAIRRANQRM